MTVEAFDLQKKRVYVIEADASRILINVRRCSVNSCCQVSLESVTCQKENRIIYPLPNRN